MIYRHILDKGSLRCYNKVTDTNVNWFVELETKLVYLKNNVIHVRDHNNRSSHSIKIDCLLPIRKFYHMNNFVVILMRDFENVVFDLDKYDEVTDEDCFESIRNSKSLKQIANCIYTDNHILYCGRQYMHVSNLDNYVFDDINAIKITEHVVLIDESGTMKVLKLPDIKTFMLNGMYLVYNKKLHIINYSEAGLVYKYCCEFNGKIYVNKCGVHLMIVPEEKIVIYFTTSGVCCWYQADYLDNYGGLNECILLH